MKKSFKIANRPLTTTNPEAAETKIAPPAAVAAAKTRPETKKALEIKAEREGEAESRPNSLVSYAAQPPREQPTTRKTIEVPEEYFHKVKMRAVERRIKEKDLWAEILFEYFINHP